ncbi:PucR family transcriptional regulator [Nocardioides sp. SOB77]|uniref:PucR family transcriptional regulator n=1 Tax=Nocardioides oceani TaxID=3058369 RepID=A0ABT8FCR4_9ACTN|nr:PucR family transcriptional regulator [Nocardioides oceani]MDN4172379.1 PucR family transcriptional regulator [Nocardioides oceani]
MFLTVGSLVDDPLIRTRVVAGASGLDRIVSWAHTCELADPWNWMGEGDLLMTDGYGFPPDADQQVEFVRNLEKAGIAALALAEGFVAPALTPEAAATADDLAFPLLVTARSVPFVTIGRVVAERNQGRSGSQSARVLRIYDVLRRMHTRELEGDHALLHHLGLELGAQLHVVDLRRGRELLPAATPLEPGLREALVEKARKHAGQLPGFGRLVHERATAIVVPVGGDVAGAGLVVRVDDDQQPDLLLIQHVAMIVGLDVERRAARASRARDRGSSLVHRLLDGTIAPEAAESQLRALGLGPGPWRVTAWDAVEGPEQPGEAVTSFPGIGAAGELAEDLAAVPWASAQSVVGGVQLVVVAETAYQSEMPADAREIGARVGASQPFSSAARLADAAREARWALEGAQATDTGCVEYGTQGSSFMPRTVAEGEAVVRRLLGAVIDYDDANDTDLMRSLWVYFEVNRSWQEGARRLGIHKQTLVYRLKKVEELTGADLRDFGTQADLYLALRTWRLLLPR